MFSVNIRYEEGVEEYGVEGDKRRAVNKMQYRNEELRNKLSKEEDAVRT